MGITKRFIMWGSVLLSCGALLSNPLPFYDVEDMTYLGAFRLPHGTFGDARVAWTGGQIALNLPNGSFFFSGSNKISVGEFLLPENLSKSANVTDLDMVPKPIQPFTNIIPKAESGNPTDVNRITGMSYIEGKLIVNAAVYYDGNANNDNTTLIVESPENILSSVIRGFMKMEGRNHSAGWISKIPISYHCCPIDFRTQSSCFSRLLPPVLAGQTGL